MINRKRTLIRRLLVCLLVAAMIIPSGFVTQKKSYAATSATKDEPVLSKTDYRYLLVGESYDFNIRNKIPGSTYTWKSSDTKVATINRVGLVKAKAAGTATITCDIKAGDENYTLIAKVYVKKSMKIPAKEIDINNKIDTLVVGERYNLNKSTKPSKTTDYVNWSSSNTNIATVNDRGFVTGLKNGKVTITATTMSGKAKDSVNILVSNVYDAVDQKSLEAALLSEAPVIRIKTDEEKEFTIPKGDYKGKALIVEAPNCSVRNYGVFDEIQIKQIKAETWMEFAIGNVIFIRSNASRIVINEDASVEIHIVLDKSNTAIVNEGELDLFIEASGNVDISGASGVLSNITISSSGVVLATDVALEIDAQQRFTLILSSPEAANSIITALSKEFIPNIQGVGSVRIIIDGVSTTVGNPPASGGSSGPSTDPSPPTPTPTPVPEPTPELVPDKVIATFGSPYVDGDIDDIWADAQVIVPKIYGSDADVTAEYRLMWDDNALYILAEIKDTVLDKSNSASYQQDSLELFLDELYDKASSYQADDLHYRVNFENMRTYDNGEKTRFYSGTKVTTDAESNTTGYIVEACIIWDPATVPANGNEMGFDLQINEAKNGSRATTITIFDSTGMSYQNPSLFGKLVLEGKTDDSVTGINPYSLLNYIASVKEIYLDAYVNKSIIDAPLLDAEQIASDINSTQAEIDAAFDALKAAVDALDDGSGYTKPSALPMVSALPNAYVFRDGTNVTTLEEWARRQEEISDMYQYYMYGVMPDGSLENVTYQSISSYTTMVFDWATWTMIEKTIEAGPNQKFIEISIEKGGKTVKFIATATLPSVTVEGVTTLVPPEHADGYPVLIVIGSLGSAQKNYLNNNGYAVIEFSNNEIAADDANRTGIFYELYPYGPKWDEQTGVLMAWGWGVSKIIDVLEIDSAGSKSLNISPVNTIVTGVSRNGKAAAVAGAFDSRIKVTAPASSGAGGMASFRYNSAGKTYDYSSLPLNEFIDHSGEANGTATWQSYQDNPTRVVGSNEGLSNLQAAGEAHWFNDNFLDFSSPNQLPFDQHFLAALTAAEDRYFYITGEVDGGDWINAAGMYVSYLAGRNMYEYLGIEDNIAIHLHSTGHAFTLEDVKYLVEFCNKNFYGEIDGVMDLTKLQTSLYELPVNYDPYLDTVKSMPGPNLAKSSIYSETFNGSLEAYITAASGSAISIDTSQNALKVDRLDGDGTVNILLASATSGAAITMPPIGSEVTISLSLMYDAPVGNMVTYEIGIVEDSIDGPFADRAFAVETEIGQNKGKWIRITIKYTLTNKDTYLRIRAHEAPVFYIDDILIK